MKENAPPALARRLATWFMDELLLEELQGDLLEVYQDRVSVRGKLYAGMMYWVDTLYLIIAFKLRQSSHTKPNQQNMRYDFLKNYFAIAMRRLVRDAKLSWINFIGLTSGIAICLFILLYILDEKSYNTFHPDTDQVYRIYSKMEFDKNKPYFSSASPYISPENISKDITSIQEITNVRKVPNAVMNTGEKVFYENEVFLADENVFTFFPFTFIQGSSNKSIAGTNAMVITNAMAVKYFGTEDAIGKSITLKFATITQEFFITAVIELPHNSTFKPDFIASSQVFGTLFPDFENNWSSIGWETYVHIQQGAVRKQAESTLDELVVSKMGDNKFYSLYLQPFTDIHLNAERAPISSAGNYSYLFVLGSIGIFILFLACFNYINLTTSRMSLRDKEIALRKLNGARYGDLIKQFYFECIILCGVSFVAAAVLVISLLPVFNQITEKKIPVDFLGSPGILLSFTGIFLITVFFSGGYPAIVLSRRSPLLNVLRNRGMLAFARGISFRQCLIVFQIVIASILLVATFVVIQQTRYVTAKDIGLDKDQIVVIDIKDIDLSRKYQYLKSELSSLAGVRSVSASSISPLFGTGKVGYTISPEVTGTINHIIVDESFQKVYSIRLNEGRWLSDNVPSDVNNAVILNQAAVDFFKLDSPIGQKIVLNGNRKQQAQVIGVTENFNYEPLYKSIEPLVMHIDTTDLGFYFPYQKLTLKLTKGEVPQTLERIQQKWKSITGNVPLTYTFFDDSFDSAYRQEQRISWLLMLATALALLIVCLGLAGVSFFVAELRKREIAIRKVLGGEASHIVYILTSKYVRLVLIAFCISIPFAYFFVSEWLKNFAFRISVSPFIFIVTLGILLALSWGLIAWNAYKSSQLNPASILRN